ncbi:hypothetical protein ACIHEI_17010 [Kitasatospora sp. NPDC051984]|uniref:AraC-like ligand-binding domain-containing protein n=1 Tax=Kitasatospora sp. NPDC051984 TaxID=3364059 RepID=UPI0037CB819E
MGLQVTSAAVPDDEKAAFWSRDLSRALVPVEGHLASHRLGYVRISTLEADAARVSRPAALIARDRRTEPQVGVEVQVSGRAVLEQARRTLRPGRPSTATASAGTPR